ncbi:MAG TPA: serine/threonine-protein kinase, partial [Gemmataceae bacterium]|nr:serine/threonine-protein kinase [Gemmataceae bacterium]
MPDTRRLDELLARWSRLRATGEAPSVEELCRDCPELLPELRQRIDDLTAQDVGNRITAFGAPASDYTVDAPSPRGVRASPAYLRPAQAEGELGRLGPYRVLKQLGRGGMGMLFLAEDPALQRQVALKVMLPQVAADPAAKARFLREARAAAKIEHDHVITIYQVAEDNGVPFIAMQLLQGEPLDARLKREGRLPALETARIACEAAEGLAAAHAKGLVHRDVKPGNIWIETRGRVKVLDFGLARPVEGDSDISRSGQVVGTPSYMAPEQARGLPVDARADLFALGCVLYHALTGRQPFRGPTAMATLADVLTEMPPDPATLVPSLPAALRDLLGRLLAKDPQHRPASAAEVARELAAIAWQVTPTLTEAAPVAVEANPFADIDTTELANGGRQPPVADTVTGEMRQQGADASRSPRPRSTGPLLIAALVVVAAGVTAYFAVVKKPSQQTPA